MAHRRNLTPNLCSELSKRLFLSPRIRLNKSSYNLRMKTVLGFSLSPSVTTNDTCCLKPQLAQHAIKKLESWLRHQHNYDHE